MKKWFIIGGLILALIALFLMLNKDKEKTLTLEIEENSLYKSSVTYKDGYKTILNLSLESSAKVKIVSNFKCDFNYDAEGDVVSIDSEGHIIPLKEGSTKVFSFCKKDNLFSNYIEVVVAK